MSADLSNLLKFVDPQRYFDKFFAAGVYPDGRSVEHFRDLSFKRGVASTGTVVGSALLKQAGTTVSCYATSTIAVVSDAPLFTLKLSAETKISKKVLREVSDVLECLLAQEKFTTREAHRSSDPRMEWRFTLTIKIMHMDGPILDAILSVVLATLGDIRVPKVILNHEIDDESPIDAAQVSVDMNEKYPIKLSSYLVASTFGFYKTSDGEELILCDSPTDILSVFGRKVEIVLNSQKQIVYLRTKGGDLSEDALHNIMNLAVQRQADVEKALRYK